MSKDQKRTYLDVQCSHCGIKWPMRNDVVLHWKGRCRSCAQILINQMSHVIEARRKSGKDVMARVGRLNAPKRENRIRGESHHFWRGGITAEMARIRNSLETRVWRKAVFERDGYKCVLCGVNDHDLHVDHIKPFSTFPSLRFEVSNGRTLCQPCHRACGAITRLGRIVKESISLRKRHDMLCITTGL